MNTINLVLTASDLCDLLNGHFTYCACEAICEYLEECGRENEIYHLGDIVASFRELPTEDVEEGDNVIAELENGNSVVAQ